MNAGRLYPIVFQVGAVNLKQGQRLGIQGVRNAGTVTFIAKAHKRYLLLATCTSPYFSASQVQLISIGIDPIFTLSDMSSIHQTYIFNSSDISSDFV